MRRFRGGWLTLVGVALVCCVGARAADEESRFDLGAIDVVEVKGEKPEGWNDPISATISLDEIKKFERYDVADAANLLPGVTIQNIGLRNERLLYVRGFNSRQVPLFIDGVPVYVPYDGNVDLGRFTTFDIAEISVTKAFTSMLYGANTLGGSINLVSRRPSEKFEFDGGAGSVLSDNGDDSRWRAWGNAGTNQGNWYLQGGGSWTQSDGYRLPDEFDPVPSEDGGRRENSKNKDWKLSLKAGYTPNATDEYAISYSNQQGEKQQPPYAGPNPQFSNTNRFWRWPEWDKESVYFISKTAFGEHEYAKVRAYYDKFDNTLDSFDNATYTTQNLPRAFQSIYDDYTAGGALEVGSTRLDRHTLSAAFHYKRDVHRETDDFDLPEEKTEDEIMTLGFEDTISATDRLTMILGLSWTRQETLLAENLVGIATIVELPTDSSSALNFQGGVIYEIADSAQVRVSGSKRTRFPTIKDKYSFRFGSALPNPGLKAEDAVHFEIGLDGSWSWLDYGVNLFYSDLTDAIENVTLPPTACTQPQFGACNQLQNVGDQVNRGVEALVGAAFNEQWRMHVNYTYLNRENQSSPDIRPLDVPKHKVFGYVQYSPLPAFDLIGTGEFNSDRFSTTNGVRVADNFAIFNVKASWRPLAYFEADLGVNNVADNEYAYEEGFPESGRTYFLNLKYSQ